MTDDLSELYTDEHIGTVLEMVLDTLCTIPLADLEQHHKEVQDSISHFEGLGILLNPMMMHDGSYDNALMQQKIATGLLEARRHVRRFDLQIDDLGQKGIERALVQAVRVLAMLPVGVLEGYLDDAKKKIAHHEMWDSMFNARSYETKPVAFGLPLDAARERIKAVAGLIAALKAAHEREAMVKHWRELKAQQIARWGAK